MQPEGSPSASSDFAAVIRRALPVSCSSQGPGVRTQFLRDLAGSYRYQQRAIDMVDLDVVFRNAQSPRLGVATASGEQRAATAAMQAFLAAGGRRAQYGLLIAAFPPGYKRYIEPKLAFNALRGNWDPDVFLEWGFYEDERLASDAARVSVLLG